MESMALAACYPNGTSAPSITGKPIDIAQGWVIADDLDEGLRAGMSFVSIYAVPSSTSKLPVPLFSGSQSVVKAPVHGTAGVANDAGFTLYGLPYPGEYVTVSANGRTYSAAADAGDSVETLAAYLAAAIATDLPGTAWAPDLANASVTLTMPGLHTLTVRIGAPGTLGNTIDRQRQNVMLGVWAPNPSDRTVIGAALQVAIGQNLTVEMPDGSRSIWIGQGVSLTDKNQNELAYRRDLTVQVQWDTLDAYDAYEVTSVDIRRTDVPVRNQSR